MTRKAVIFPGQGAQAVGMGKDVAQQSVRAREIFAQADDILGFSISPLCFEGPADKLGQTDIQQPAIFVTGTAIWAAYLEAGGQRESFAYTGGLSLGEYTALYVAGAMNFEEALRLVQRRGELMQQAALASPSSMVSLIGADETKANEICDRARGDDVLAPANFNCPGQIVIAGSKAACERAVSVAEECTCRAVALAVAGAFHSPFMQSAADGLDPVLKDTPFVAPEIPVISNVNADYHTQPDQIRNALKQQVTQPVLWQRCIERMIDDGVEAFVEIGPGRVLTGLMRKINRKIPTKNISSFDAIAEAVAT